MTDIQLVEDALQKLRPIPEDQWLSGVFTDNESKCCAMGHYVRLSSSDPNNYRDSNCHDWGISVGQNPVKLRKITRVKTNISFVEANNHPTPLYEQVSCKLRTIACLEDTLLKLKQEKL